MVVIRLARVGSKKRPKYRITVADSRQWVKGKFLEVIGSFNPAPRGEEKKLILDMDKTKAWIAKGAQPTERVQSLIRMANGISPADAYKADPSIAKPSRGKPAAKAGEEKTAAAKA